jgi:poly-gamma-glutamate capsule biosynthesis protein CapA/YwtB (metallophosphatase superfamily)
MSARNITIFLCGDVMTGRGIDQVLPHPSHPQIHEPYMLSARGYLELAERRNGPIPHPAEFSYIWGDALFELEKMAPKARIINLETSVTTSTAFWEGKGINYRMHPDNFPAITAAKIDICALANNHVLDWGYSGLEETLLTIKKSGVKSVGAGRDLNEAESPAIAEIAGGGRVIVFSFGAASSGIPREWLAAKGRAGISLLSDFSNQTVRHIREKVRKVKHPGDIVIVSIHWGGNWGYEIPNEHERFARNLCDEADINIIHGHSSHHVLGIEIYKDKPIIYGCGDFINDYEGIGGYADFRGDLCLMYFVCMDPASGKLAKLSMKPMQMKNFKLNRASRADAEWLRDILNREGKCFGTRVEVDSENTLSMNH